jgi:MoxR-like ATPase
MKTQDLFERIHQEVGRVLVGQAAVVRGCFIALLCEGHVLLEGVPGIAKTLLVRLVARSLGLGFKRIQFTPDLMPADVTGTSIFNPHDTAFEFRPGPIFTEFLLCDEINRAPAKTQAALLEAMEEKTVTADGITHPLSRPFIVFATQNPIEYEGTYPLPEAQLDRFLFKLIVNYPNAEEEVDMLMRLHTHAASSSSLVDEVSAAATTEDINRAQAEIASITVQDEIVRYVSGLVRATRTHPMARVGASPRAALCLLRAAKAAAALEDRDYVVPDDVKAMAYPTLRHRLTLTPTAEVEGIQRDDVIDRILSSVEVPR